ASLLTVPRAKHGQVRHVKLNSHALAALISLKTENSKGRIHEFISPRSWFEPVVEKSGVESFTWHALRHTFVSRLVMNGVDLRTVQELAGHKTIAMTMRYAHLARATSTLLARRPQCLQPLKLPPSKKAPQETSGCSVSHRERST